MALAGRSDSRAPECTVTWRLITGTADDPDPAEPQADRGAFNMAVDQTLLEGIQRGDPPALRFYRWQPACLSLGRNQTACVDRARLERLGIDLVRRPTGGLAVLHDQELTYSLALPAGLLGSARGTYQAINRGLLAGLLSLGLSARPASEDHTAQVFRRAGSCFAAPAAGEVMALGRKLIGSAQRYERHAILQHGSILVDGDQSLADQLLGRVDGSLPAASTSMREVLGYVPGWRELTAAFASGLALYLGIPLAPACLTKIERQRAQQLTARFASEEWTWRV
jgi:lipoate-protein ligase A